MANKNEIEPTPAETEMDLLFASLAQGVINIDCGHTTIEKGSRVYRAMLAICVARNDGRLVLK